MELSPKIYQRVVRPNWFSNYFFIKTIGNTFDFKNKTILDFGCGIGTYSRMFNPKDYIGLDISKKRINYAKQLYPEYRFQSIQENRIPLKDQSVDYIIIISVLHHIPTNTLYKYLKEFKRVLKPEGKIIITEPCNYSNSKLCNFFMLHIDQGKFIRKENDYIDLFQQSLYKVKVLQKYKQLFLYNKIFITASPIKSV